jgi:hypothetical protein
VFFGGVLGLLVPNRSFIDRFTPNLLGTYDIGTCSRGISSWFGVKKMCGTVRFTKTTVDRFQNPENDIFPIYGHRQSYGTKPSAHIDR